MGLVATYTRDAQGRVSAVSLARGTFALPLVTQVGYQPFGPMSSIAFGHGQTLSKQWDCNYEPDAITSPAIDYAYTLDDVGNPGKTTGTPKICGGKTTGTPKICGAPYPSDSPHPPTSLISS